MDQNILLVEDSEDRGSIGLGDNEHPNSMGARTAVGNARCYTALCPDASGKARGKPTLSQRGAFAR